MLLPEDILIEIMLLLPARSVGRLRCVSKSWFSVSTTPYFIRTHAQQNPQRSLAIQRPDCNEFLFASTNSNNATITLRNPTIKQQLKETIVEASWQGFLLLRNSRTQHHSLFNPLTSQSVNLPNSKCESTLFMCLYLHRSTSKYRLIRLLLATNKTEVLVVGERSWRLIPGLLPAFHHHPHPVEFNRRMYWLATTQRNMYILPSFRDKKVLPDTIMTFDTETEDYNLLPLPPIEKTLNIGGNLVDFNGELGLWNMNCKYLHLWIMKNDYSWVKRYSVEFVKSPRNDHRLSIENPITEAWPLDVAIPVGNEELLIDFSVLRRDCALVIVNLKHGICRAQICMRSCSRQHRGFPYVESLAYFNCRSSLPYYKQLVLRFLAGILIISFLYSMFLSSSLHSRAHPPGCGHNFVIVGRDMVWYCRV